MDKEVNLFPPKGENLTGHRAKSKNPFATLAKIKRVVAVVFIDSNGEKKKREIRLAISCVLVILGSVFLMNLETPRSYSVKRSEADASVAGAASTEASPALKKATLSSTELLSAEMKGLAVPVLGVRPDQLRDSFYASRSEGRIHKAIDITAPLDTPVLATADGTVMKLHTSARGGIMLYQSDDTGQIVYYYGHLSRYADGMAEGKQVKKGDVIAYVGDTGNAGPGNYHLHFGVSRMAAPGKWSGGEPINPYPLLTGGR